MNTQDSLSAPEELIGKLTEILKRTPPPAQQIPSSSAYSSFNKPMVETQQSKPPLLAVQSATSDLMFIASQMLGVPECVQPLQQLFEEMQFAQTFIFECFKQFLPAETIQTTSYQQETTEQRSDKNEIQCQLSKSLVFLSELVVFAQATTDLPQSINGLMEQLEVSPPCQQVVYDLCKCVALLQTLTLDFNQVVYLLSVPVLPYYTEEPLREQIMAEIEQQQVLVHYDKIREEFFKKFETLKELMNEQILPFQMAETVQCPFGEYEKQNDRDESAKKMRIDPLMYHRLVDGVNNLVCGIREQISSDCGDQTIEFSYSLYSMNWLIDSAGFELQTTVFCLVQVLKFLYLIKNEYSISSYADSLVDEAGLSDLYGRECDFNEGLIRETTDKIIGAISELQHAPKTLNNFYENLIAPLLDGSVYDVRRHLLQRCGTEINLDEQLLGIIYYIQIIQDVKFFLNLSLQSVDFTHEMAEREQTVLQFLLSEALDGLEINAAFGVDVLQLLEAAMSHSQEETREFMSANRVMKLQDIQQYIHRGQQQFGAQTHPKALERMRQLCSRISNQDIEYQLASYYQVMQSPEYNHQAKLQVEEQLLEQLREQTGRKSEMEEVLSLEDPNLNEQEQLTNLNQLAQLALQGRQIFLETREEPLVDTVVQELTPAELFKALTDIIVKIVYDLPMTDVVFTFSGDFDVIYLAFLSNPKYFISYCLIRLSEFVQEVTNTTVHELLAASDVLIYDYSHIDQLKQVTVESHALWLELLCSPHVDIQVMELLSGLLVRFKSVGVNSFEEQLFIYRQIFNKFQALIISNKIAATALLRVFEDLDHLLYSTELQQFTLNFLRTFEYDLRLAKSVFKDINQAAAVYYAELLKYLEAEMRKDESLEILFNILKFGRQDTINSVIEQLFANVHNLITQEVQETLSPLIEEHIKLLITILTNAKQNAFEELDSSILFDIYNQFFDKDLDLLARLLRSIPEQETRYLFIFLMIVLLEECSKAHIDGKSLRDCHLLLQVACSALFARENDGLYAVEMEQKFLMLFHVIKDAVKTKRYDTLDVRDFTATVEIVASLSEQKIFMLNLLTQLLELQIFCHYYYEAELTLQFADEEGDDDERFEAHICILAREVAEALAIALQQRKPLDSALITDIVFLQMLTNYCCISEERNHRLFYCLMKPLENSIPGDDEYSKLLMARITQLTDKISLSGAAQSEEPEFEKFMQLLAAAVQKQAVTDAEMLQLGKIYSNAISGFRSDEQRLFMCSVDALGMSSQLANELHEKADKSVFEETLCGILCQKILVYIYLNFYAARNGRLKLNLAEARSVVEVKHEILDTFKVRGDIVGRICQQLANNQFGV